MSSMTHMCMWPTQMPPVWAQARFHARGHLEGDQDPLLEWSLQGSGLGPDFANFTISGLHVEGGGVTVQVSPKSYFRATFSIGKNYPILRYDSFADHEPVQTRSPWLIISPGGEQMGQFSATRQTVYSVFFGDRFNYESLDPEIARLHPGSTENLSIDEIFFTSIEAAVEAAGQHLGRHMHPGTLLDETLPFLNVEDRWRAEGETVPKLPLMYRPLHRSQTVGGVSSHPAAPHPDDIPPEGKIIRFGFKTESQIITLDSESTYRSKWYPSATHYINVWVFKSELTFVDHAEVVPGPETAEP